MSEPRNLHNKKPGFYYSGDGSKQFWKRIWKIRPKKVQDAAYLMGCTLQDLESRMHQFLREAERKAGS